MASKGYAASLLSTLPEPIRRPLLEAFQYALSTLRCGWTADGQRAENLNWYRFSATTPATASQEFTITHGLGQIPRVVFPFLPVDSSGASLVPLTVTRAADSRYLYLQSSSTGAIVYLAVEV